MTNIGYRYWNENKVIEHINKFIDEYKHFPKKEELEKMGMSNLVHAIHRNGGIKKYHKLFGYEQYYNDKGYWNEERTIEKLKIIVELIGHFPTYPELHDKKWCKILIGVSRNGGIQYFRKIFGITEEEFLSYASYRGSYVNIRGKKSEELVFGILTNYCNRMKIKQPDRNIQFPNKKIIEFVCDIGKNIGVDVTNTENKKNIVDKWKLKKYNEYLDELWIVVISDSFVKEEYVKWNKESPDNVYIMSIDDFCNELEFSLNEFLKNKINAYKKCTFHTKEECKKSVLNKKEGSSITS